MDEKVKLNFDQVKILLVVTPTDPKCFEMFNLLKFGQIKFDVD